MIVQSYAKINWALRITGRRDDGFHDLETVFQQISLHDTLTFTPASSLSLTCSDPSIPTDASNLVLRAAALCGAPSMSIHLQKRIPAGGGLGGGSSNAAATLIALGNPDPDAALSLGSDVPYFLKGGTAYARGRGELLTAMPPMTGIPLLLVLPEERVLTKHAFAHVTRYSEPLGLDAYRTFDNFTNDFEEPVFTLLPRLREFKERLLRTGAFWAGMSGSGSTIVGAFETPAARDAALGAFSDVHAVAAITM